MRRAPFPQPIHKITSLLLGAETMCHIVVRPLLVVFPRKGLLGAATVIGSQQKEDEYSVANPSWRDQDDVPDDIRNSGRRYEPIG